MIRRRFLKVLGAVSIVVVSGSVWRAVDQGVFSSGKGSAYEPWKDWHVESDGVMNLVRAAILAANPHNTQPWLFNVTDSQINVYADTNRHLGSMDVYRREMYIGLGCALENMLVAAAATGYEASLELMVGQLEKPSPPFEPKQVATINLKTNSEPTISALYNAIPLRHTDRALYTNQSIPDTILDEFQALYRDNLEVKVLLFNDVEKRDAVTNGCVIATKEIIRDREMSRDSANWFRHDWDDVQERKDGPHIDTAGVSPWLRAVVKLLPPVSEEVANKAWINSTKSGCESSPIIGLIAVQDLYESETALQAGRLWQRMHLWATTQGISMQPVNQMCEIVDRERELGKKPQMAELLNAFTGEPDWKPTFVFRMGYPTMTPLKSPRRSVNEILV